MWNLEAVYRIAVIIGTSVSVAGAIVTVAAILIKFGGMKARFELQEKAFDAKMVAQTEVIETRFNAVDALLTQFAQGKGATCAAHSEQLLEHTRRLDNHDSRITVLERGHNGRPMEPKP